MQYKAGAITSEFADEYVLCTIYGLNVVISFIQVKVLWNVRPDAIYVFVAFEHTFMTV